MKATGIENVGTLGHLESLSIGIADLESFDFLARVPAGLADLSLGATRSRKPTLDVLARRQSLAA